MSTFASAARSTLGRSVVVLAAVGLGVLLAVQAFAQPTGPSPEALEGLDAYEAVELANTWKGNEVTSFATSDAVHFAFPTGEEVRIDMPADEMFVSVAPYLRQTHPCTTHSMSGCQGELADRSMRVRATLPDGTVVLDETMNTGANGFLDLWLPREQGLMLSVEMDGYAAEALLTTFADSPTCITTVQLAAGG
jgi:hypothetical protein